MFDSVRQWYMKGVLKKPTEKEPIEKKPREQEPRVSPSVMSIELLRNVGQAASNRISSSSAAKQLALRTQQLFPDSETFAVFLPNNRFLEGWDLVMVFLLAYTGVVSPVDAAFLPTRFDAIFFINRLLDLSFFIDLILQFNIAYVAENGVGLVKNRRKIAFRYLCGWFCFDLFSVCPFDLLNFMVSADVTNLQV
eukprot:gene19221-22978_t